MYYIGNIEIFDPKRYGKDEENSLGIEYQWMVIWCSITSFDDDVDINNPNDCIEHSKQIAIFQRRNVINLICRNTHIISNELSEPKYLSHIENSENICKHYSYLQPQLIMIDILPGGECVGYPKGSFWIKIFQRKWRNILMKRVNKMNKLKCLKNMMNREMGIKASVCVA